MACHPGCRAEYGSPLPTGIVTYYNLLTEWDEAPSRNEIRTVNSGHSHVGDANPRDGNRRRSYLQLGQFEPPIPFHYRDYFRKIGSMNMTIYWY